MARMIDQGRRGIRHKESVIFNNLEATVSNLGHSIDLYTQLEVLQ